MQITQIGKEAARFFVYYCEEEQYVSLMEQFRQAQTRRMLIEVIHSFLYLGESIKVKQKQLQITPTKWKTLCQFIEQAGITDVRQLHASMIAYIARLEIQKIHRMEKYLTKRLTDF